MFQSPISAIRLLLFSSILVSAMVSAQTTIQDAWVRGTVASQSVSGAFLKITSAVDAKLVALDSNVSSRVELHEMAMHDNIMRMRQVEFVRLPAGKTIELKPGGYHLMLFGLQQALTDGTQVSIRLSVTTDDGRTQKISVQAPVVGLGKSAPMGKMKH